MHGVVERTAPAATGATLDWAAIARELATPAPPRAPLEIVFFADAKVHDGRFGNSAWLQELGDPVTKLAWDNAALVSPSTAAQRSGIANEDVVELEVRGRTVRAPVARPARHGRRRRRRRARLRADQPRPGLVVSSGVGANAYAVRDSRAPWFDDASMRKTGDSWPLALTQEHWSMEGRPIVLSQDARRVPRGPGLREGAQRDVAARSTASCRTRPTSGG